MRKTKSVMARNSSELAKAMGMSESDGYRWELRSGLVGSIIELIAKAGLTHAEVAKKAKTSRTRITSILNRNIDDVSTDLLIRIIEALGYRVTFSVMSRKAAA